MLIALGTHVWCNRIWMWYNRPRPCKFNNDLKKVISIPRILLSHISFTTLVVVVSFFMWSLPISFGIHQEHKEIWRWSTSSTSLKECGSLGYFSLVYIISILFDRFSLGHVNVATLLIALLSLDNGCVCLQWSICCMFIICFSCIPDICDACACCFVQTVELIWYSDILIWSNALCLGW